MKATSAAFARVFKASPVDWTREDLLPLTGAELEVCCKLMGIAHSGTNPQKLDRLLVSARVRDALSQYTADHAGAAEIAKRYKRMELVSFARSVGAFYSLPKVGIAVSLINWREACRKRGSKFLEEWREHSRSVPRQMRLAFDE